MKKNSTRNSSLEFLRIICMLLIIAHHYFAHGGLPSASFDTLSAGYIFLQMMSMFGRSACSIFALISGFFLIESDCKKHYRKIVPIIAQMFFYSIAILAIVYPLNLVQISGKDIIKSVVPLLGENWYVLYYCLFYLFIPFINIWLHSMSQSQYKKIIFLIIVVWCIVPTFTARTWSFSSIDFFFVMYLIGAYIKLHVHGKMTYKNSINLCISLISALLLILSACCLDFLGVILKQNIFIEKATYFREYSSILSLIFAISTFLYFSNKHFESNMVNTIAASTMGIYLLHDNHILRRVIWEVISPNATHLSFPYLHFVVKVLLVFLCCFIIDWLREKTFGYLFKKWFSKHCDSFVSFFQKRLIKKNTRTKQPKTEETTTSLDGD